MARQYWLMKTEPGTYSIDDLKREKTAYWDGVRNYQARNFMRDGMNLGDQVLFYHSNAKPPGVAGVAEICKTGYPDFTAWDRKSKYFDPKSQQNKPSWFMVDVKFTEKFPAVFSLEHIKSDVELGSMMVAKKGSRLSIQPVEKKHFDRLCRLARK